MAFPVNAQSYSFSNVRVEGNERVDPASIVSYAGIARGETVSAAELNDAYQRIRGSGLFEEVSIDPQGSTLVIRVREFPTINRINFEGNRRIDDEDLAPVIKSQSRRVYNPSVAEQDAAAITEAYSQQGRLAARVTPRVIRRNNNRVDLVFEIFEGDVVEIERIGFVGNRAYSDGRLRRVLETKQAGLLRALIRRDTFVEDRIGLDRQMLRDFYLSRGYVDFRVLNVNAELTEERDGHFVTFTVQEGQQFRFGNITASSDVPGVNAQEFLAATKTRSGRVYSPTYVENDIARLERLAVKKGLDFIRVEPQITRNERDLTLNIDYVISKGPRVFVERIDIEGNTTTLDRVIRRQFKVVEGDPFNPREVREAAERIRALGFFTNAEVNAREGSSRDQVIVDVDVEEQNTGSLTFGGTYSSNNGLGALIRFRETNFLGRGQLLSLGISSAAENRQYTLRFSEPAFLGRDLRFDLDIGYVETDNLNSEYDTRIGRFVPSLTFPVSENGSFSTRVGFRSSEIVDLSSDVGGVITAEAARGQEYDAFLGYTYSYDTRRTGLNPNTGVLLEFGQDFGGLDGSDQYIKTTARAIAQTRVLNEEVTLRATLEGGMLNYTSGSSRVTDRFLLGSGMMRGFEYGGIGPRERNAAGTVNDALGGNMYVVAKLEAEFPLGLPEEYGISGGVFYDMGSVWDIDNGNAATIYDDFYLRHVVGVSVFWDTPIGPLRFNFSEPLIKRQYDEPQRFDLTLSTEF